LWWAKEYGAAKDEIIRAKEAQIEQLKGEIQSLHDLTPMKIREYFVSVTTQLEEYNDRLKQEIDKARVEIEQKNQAIARYSQDTDLAIDELNKLKAEKSRLEDKAESFEKQLSDLLPITKLANRQVLETRAVELDASKIQYIVAML